MDAISERYHKVPKKSKTRLLDELYELCGYHASTLSRKSTTGGRTKKSQSPDNADDVRKPTRLR